MFRGYAQQVGASTQQVTTVHLASLNSLTLSCELLCIFFFLTHSLKMTFVLANDSYIC